MRYDAAHVFWLTLAIMNDNPYNKLPQNIKRKFEIVYSELQYDNITIFKNKSDKWGVLIVITKFGIFSSYACLIKPIYNSIGFNKNLKLIVAEKYENNVRNQDTNIQLYFDIKGEIIWQSKIGERISIDEFGNIFTQGKNKIGLLDKGFTQIIEPKYERLKAIKDSLFIAIKNGKFGIINREEVNILDFEYNDIFKRVEKNKVIVRKNENYFSFDFENNSLIKLPFSKILNASSNTYKAPSAESLKYYKSITNLKENPHSDDYDNYEIGKYIGKWGIIDGAGDVIIPNDYCFVDFLRNPKYFKVGIGEVEMKEFEDGEQNYRTSIENVKWGIVDINNNIIVPIEYDWIDEVESTVWVVYKGGIVFYNDDYQEDYWTIINGKLGVYNLTKLITPIEYDAIMKTWFRIKDYVFVQKRVSYFDENNAEYEVYTLDGKKVENNKPKPKNHHNNG